MTSHSMIFWNIHRLFGSAGSPIEHALNEGDAPAGYATEEIAAKLDVIAAVIDHIAGRAGPPLIVGLVEVETAELAQAIAERVTVADLECVDLLAEDQTGFALDGLNISMLIDRQAVIDIPLLRSHVITRTFNTRDVLECDMKLADGSALTVLVNHWPSRMIGEATSQRTAAAHYVNRLVAAKTRYQLNEMWNPDRQLLEVPNKEQRTSRARTPVVAMGDFNDEVFNQSLEILGSTSDPDAVRDDLHVKGRTKKSRFRTYIASPPLLLNPMWRYADGKQGSYYRTPRWRTYDQILIGRGLLEDGGTLAYVPDSGTVFDDKEVILPDGSPWPITNRGSKPIPFSLADRRGCSDHLPVWLQVVH